MVKLQIGYFIPLFFLLSCGPQLPEDINQAYQELPSELDYNIHVKPILSDRCFACHGNDKNKLKAGLRLDNAEDAYAELPESPNKVAIDPGSLSNSEVFHRLLSDDPNLVMPPPESNLQLAPYEKAVLIRWIQDGAKYKPHWAFIPPENPKIPKVTNQDWTNNPIDQFVLHQLESNGWAPSPQADKETLLRRVTFDLTGLPPTLEEIEAFLKDNSASAYEKVVDRLLASPQYAERMTTNWMDVARFADTHGYTVDRYRDMSPWRDWVIQAFDQNMPYDTFTIWQLAGDLLPNPTPEQILATGFNRNHQQNMEGGIIEEEFRVEYVADRTNTLGAAYLGLTVECARCHDHKYDPISQKEYFQLFSFFNNVREAGQISWDNAMPVPTLLLPKAKEKAIIDFIDRQIDSTQLRIKLEKEQAKAKFEQWLVQERQHTNLGKHGLVAHFDFQNKRLSNRINPKQQGRMKQMFAKAQSIPTNFTTGKNGTGLQLDGDAWIDFESVGQFDKATPFSISLWINIPKNLENGVIFHKGKGTALYNLRGYHLALKDNQLEILMAHTAPYNAIIKYAQNPPRDEWIQLTLTYDGSAKAQGLNAYLNGQLLPQQIEVDKLYKDIVFRFENEPEPGLQIGARWRGAGIKGAIVDEILVFDRMLTTLEVQNLVDPQAVNSVIQKPRADLSNEELSSLKELYQTQIEELKHHQAELQQLKQRQNRIRDTIQEVMVMREMEKPRPTFILDRGQYDAPGDPVFPATIEAVLPLPAEYPKNRLGLAQWLFHPDHPLTARVAVNRFWQQFFGRGLAKSVTDFGNQGALPTHPALLDWLALHFQESGWDVKALLRTIVLSATYQQSSRIREDLAEQDVENVYLWRGPSQRLTAEMMRDNALAASGLLHKKIGGKSVKPYQPAGLWKINGQTYKRDEGEKLYRRSLYTLWKRTVPNPTQGTFDAPTRSFCTVERQKTSTPLQALVLLNDPTYLEAAKVLGQQMAQLENTRLAIAQTFQKLTGRQAEQGELDLLLQLLETEYRKFEAYPEKMKGWLSAGETSIDADISQEFLAAHTVVASTILNADATIIKR